MVPAANYGELSPVVSQATSLMSAAGALAALSIGQRTLGVQLNNNSIPRRVAGVVDAGIIAYLYFRWREQGSAATLTPLVIGVIVTVVFASLYVWLTARLGYRKPIGAGPDPKWVKFIGGFTVLPNVAERMTGGEALSKIIPTEQYEASRIWTPDSFATAQLAVTLSAVLVVVGATTLLASAAMLISAKPP